MKVKLEKKHGLRHTSTLIMWLVMWPLVMWLYRGQGSRSVPLPACTAPNTAVQSSRPPTCGTLTITTESFLPGAADTELGTASSWGGTTPRAGAGPGGGALTAATGSTGLGAGASTTLVLTLAGAGLAFLIPKSRAGLPITGKAAAGLLGEISMVPAPATAGRVGFKGRLGPAPSLVGVTVTLGFIGSFSREVLRDFSGGAAASTRPWLGNFARTSPKLVRRIALGLLESCSITGGDSGSAVGTGAV